MLLAISVLSCCSRAIAHDRGDEPRSLSIVGIARATHISSSGMNLYVEVDNTTGRRLVIKRGEIEIMVGGSPKVTISLREKVIIAKGYDDELLLPLRFRSASTLTLGSILRRIATNDNEEITLSYRIRGGTWLIRKTFCREDIAISEIFNTFAISEAAIAELSELFR